MTRFLTSLLALSASALISARAEAQTRTAVANMAASSTGSAALAAPPPSAPVNDEARERHAHPMGWAGVGVKVGLASMGAAKGNLFGLQGRTDARLGAQVSVPIQLGGEGASFTLEPYFARSSVSHDLKDASGNVVGTGDVGLNALGAYLGPTFNIHVARPVYLGFGFGLKAGYLLNNAFDYAVDAMARVPLHATYYVNDHLAFVAEVGLGYGASVFADKPRIVIDPITRSVTNTKDDPQFGTAFAWDASFGVRLP